MKRFLTVIFLFISFSGISQVTVSVKPSDTILCHRDSITFTAYIDTTGTGALTYQWMKNGVKLPGETDSIFKIQHVTERDTAFYQCIVIFISTPETYTDTSNNGHLRMHPKLKLDTLYRYNPLGCLGECKGQFKALASGGTPYSDYPPYIYDWNAGHSQDTIVFGLCPRFLDYPLTIMDSVGCTLDTTYFVDYLKSPKVDFTLLPKDTVYLTNPNIQVEFPDSMKKYIANWTWDFGDDIKVPNVNPCTHTYSKTGQFPVQLSFTDLNGCDTTIMAQLTVKVAELKIPNVFTPNGDGINDDFVVEIKGESKDVDYRLAYLSNSFVVFDRWGKKVFSQNNYQSGDWDGANLSDGTYFYILKCIGQFGDDVFRGSVAILRSAP
jgi:gliding motility-associated-like protein